MANPTLSEQMRDGNLFVEECPSRDVLKHVTSRWGVLILIALRTGTHRFSDLRRKMGGVSEKMLAQSLQAMETARVEANRQTRYLSVAVAPVAPDEAAYPRAFENTLVVMLIFAGIYLMVSMTVAILREQVSA